MRKDWFIKTLIAALTALVLFTGSLLIPAAFVEDEAAEVEVSGEAGVPAEETIAEAETGEELEQSRSGRIINYHTTEVSTYDELVDALRDENYTDIYFANDITASAAAQESRRAVIHAGKKVQRIYGHAYGGSERFTFTQAGSNDSNNTIQVLNGSAVTEVVVSDMNIIGRNYYGVVQVDENLTGVNTRYEHISYTGPQPVHNRSGKAQFADVEIKIVPGWDNSSGEIAEASDIEFEGKVVIDSNVSGNGDAVFWLTRIGDQSGTFRVKEGADVRISANSYLFYTGGDERYSPDLHFETGSSFYAECGLGFMMQYVNRLEVAPGAQVSFVQKNRASDYGLRIREELYVGAGAFFEVQRYSGSGAALQIYNAGQIHFDDPGRVVVYAHNSLLTGFSAINSQIEITTDALNLWRQADGDAPQKAPSGMWNKNGTGKLTVTSVWSGNSAASTISNLDMAADPVTENISNDTFLLRSSQLMVLGRIALEVDPVTDEDESVTGRTAPGAALTAAYTTAGGQPGTAEAGTADAKGTYALALVSGRAQPGSRLDVTASSDRLYMRQYTMVEETVPVLEFLKVPDLWFETTTLPTEPVIVKREDPDWAVMVQDTRHDSPGFRVDVSIAAPLTAQQGDTLYELPEALIFRDYSGKSIALSEDPLTVYSTSSAAPGRHTISWEEDQGLLAQAVPGDQLLSDMEYRTIIQWSLVSAP